MTPASGAADHKLSEEKREELGRLVRDVWTHWASSQTDIDAHPNWMASWLGLMEREREVDRMIGTAVYLRAKAEGHSDGSALAALKARIDGERKRANERIEAKRQQGYVYGALQYECNDDVVRLALLERLEAADSKTEASE